MEHVDDLGIDDRATPGDLSDGPRKLVDVRHSFLQQVAAAMSTLGEQRERIRRLEVVAQHDDTDAGMGHPQLLGGAHALVGACGWHTNVGEDDVGVLGLDEREQAVEVLADAHDLEIALLRDEGANPLAHQDIVLGEDEADGHGSSVMTGLRARNGAYPHFDGAAGTIHALAPAAHTREMSAGTPTSHGPVLSAAAVLSRAMVLALLAAFIGIVYLALPVGLGALLGTGASTLLAVAATAIVAMGFARVRTASERLAQRLVYGDRASPYEVLAELSDRMAGASNSPDVLADMARIVAEGSGSESSRVWLRVGDELTVAAAWPDQATVLNPVPLVGDELPPVPDAQLTMPVRHRGELIGAITVRQFPSEPLSPADLRLLHDIAAQAGLVLRNVRLTTELAAQLEKISEQAAEIRASRERIVAAQDAERRRVERDIHDGAQQYLVALMVQLRVARTLVRRDGERARKLALDLRLIIRETLGTLNDLAQGIHPPVLTKHGLTIALRRQEANPALRVTVEGDGVGRYPGEVEAAVYFACLEALNNAAKHTAGASVAVRLTEADGHLVFSVRDDGSGFDPEASRPGSGLGNMVDRVAAVGGALEVTSAPSRGTHVRGRVPLRASERAA